MRTGMILASLLLRHGPPSITGPGRSALGAGRRVLASGRQEAYALALFIKAEEVLPPAVAALVLGRRLTRHRERLGQRLPLIDDCGRVATLDANGPEADREVAVRVGGEGGWTDGAADRARRRVDVCPFKRSGERGVRSEAADADVEAVVELPGRQRRAIGCQHESRCGLRSTRGHQRPCRSDQHQQATKPSHSTHPPLALDAVRITAKQRASSSPRWLVPPVRRDEADAAPLVLEAGVVAPAAVLALVLPGRERVSVNDGD